MIKKGLVLFTVLFAVFMAYNYLYSPSTIENKDVNVKKIDSLQRTESLINDERLKNTIVDVEVKSTVDSLDIKEKKSRALDRVNQNPAPELEDVLTAHEAWKNNEKYLNVNELEDIQSYWNSESIDSEWSANTEQAYLALNQDSEFLNKYPGVNLNEIICKTKLCQLKFSGIDSINRNFVADLMAVSSSERFTQIKFEAPDQEGAEIPIYVIRGEH